MSAITTFEDLELLSRKDLQALAKEHGIKANSKSSVIIEELLQRKASAFYSPRIRMRSNYLEPKSTEIVLCEVTNKPTIGASTEKQRECGQVIELVEAFQQVTVSDKETTNSPTPSSSQLVVCDENIENANPTSKPTKSKQRRIRRQKQNMHVKIIYDNDKMVDAVAVPKAPQALPKGSSSSKVIQPIVPARGLSSANKSNLNFRPYNNGFLPKGAIAEVPKSVKL